MEERQTREAIKVIGQILKPREGNIRCKCQPESNANHPTTQVPEREHENGAKKGARIGIRCVAEQRCWLTAKRRRRHGRQKQGIKLSQERERSASQTAIKPPRRSVARRMPCESTGSAGCKRQSIHQAWKGEDKTRREPDLERNTDGDEENREN